MPNVVLERATMDGKDLLCQRGRIGVVFATTERVCVISAKINNEHIVVLALVDLVYSGSHCAPNLKLLESKQIKFDAVRDLHSPFGSFWKTIHAWTATKMQNTDPSEDWIKLKRLYNHSKKDIQELLLTHKQKVMDFLLKEVPMEDHLVLFDYFSFQAQNHLLSLGKNAASIEKRAILFYMNLINDRDEAVDCLHAHSFLQKSFAIRNHLKSNYQISNLTEFFQNHPTYFLVEEQMVSIQPVWFLMDPQFPPKEEFHPPQQSLGNGSAATNGNNIKSKKKAVEDFDHRKLKRNLRSVVVSFKGGIPLQKLQDEYAQLVGKAIPFQESGYSSLETMLNDMQDVVRLIRTVGGQILVMAVSDSSTDHLAKLVARQKGGKPFTGGSKASAQVHVPTAVKTCVPALEKKTIRFFARAISSRLGRQGDHSMVNATTAKEFLTEASEDVSQYVKSLYGGDPKTFFLRYPECFHITRTGNIFPQPFKKITEFVTKTNSAPNVVAQSSKKASEVRQLPTPLWESPLDWKSEASYSESDSCFSVPTPTKETSKEQSKLVFDTLKNLLRNSESYGANREQEAASSVSDVPDLFEVDLGFHDLIDLNETLAAFDHLTSKEPRTRDIGCQTISTGPILSMSVYNF